MDLFPNADGELADNRKPVESNRVSVPQNHVWSSSGKQRHVDVKRDLSNPLKIIDATDDPEEAVYDVDDVSDTESDVSDTYNDDDSLMSSRNDNLFSALSETRIRDHPDVPQRPESPAKREGPYWVARGKKGIRDYIPFYWGSNQNMLGKTTFSRSAISNLFPLRPSNAIQNDRSGTEASHLIKSSGWESNQQFWGKRNNGPFWIARGKKGRNDKSYIMHHSWGSNPPYFGKRNSAADAHFQAEQSKSQTVDRRGDNGPFWLSRGKRSQILDEGFTPWMLEELSNGQSKNFWTPRGKKEEEEGGGTRPFWISRGKKRAEKSMTPVASTKDATNPFWVSRGKKEQSPFWIARGKKDRDSGGDDGKTDKPFWIARGKKGAEANPFRETKEGVADSPFWDGRYKKEREDNSFWVARGKKEKDDNAFWAVRGKKTVVNNPYWISRGKKEDAEDLLDNPFWVARGKKERDENPFWVSRGKKEEVVNPYWIARGKRPRYEQTDEEGPFWVVRGRRDNDQNTQQGDSERLLQYLDAVLASDHKELPSNELLRRKKSILPDSSN